MIKPDGVQRGLVRTPFRSSAATSPLPTCLRDTRHDACSACDRVDTFHCSAATCGAARSSLLSLPHSTTPQRHRHTMPIGAPRWAR